MPPGRPRDSTTRWATLAGAAVAIALITWLVAPDASEGAARHHDPAFVPPSVAKGVVGAGAHATDASPEATRFLAASVASSSAATALSLSVPQVTRAAGLVVRASDASPLDDVEVSAFGDDPVRGTVQLGWVKASHGRFEIGPEIMRLGPSYLSVRWSKLVSGDQRREPTSRTVSERIVLADTSEPLDDLFVVLDTGWQIRGRVMHRASGEGVGHIDVLRDGRRVTITEVDGSYIVRDLDPVQALVHLQFMSGSGADRFERAAEDVAAPPAGILEIERLVVIDFRWGRGLRGR